MESNVADQCQDSCRKKCLDPGPMVIAPWVSSHVFEDQLLLFSERGQALYELNQSAAFIWLCCEKHMRVDEISAQMSESFGIGLGQARADLEALIEQWRQLELVQAEGGAIMESLEVPDELTTVNLIGKGYDIKFNPIQELKINFAGFCYLLRFCDWDVAKLIQPVFAHLEGDIEANPKCLEVIRTGDQFLIVQDGLILDEFSDIAETAPRLSNHLVVSSYRNVDFLIAIHAAVLSLGNKCVLFPGTGGVGKSTLSAALIKDGFKYFSDDTAILDRATRRIVPTPLSPRIKEGSWNIVEGMFPELFSTVIHNSGDGRKIRYLRPPAENYALLLEDGPVVNALVFPEYSPEFKTRLSPVSRLGAIRRIQQCGYDVSSDFDNSKVSELLDWIKDVNCYEMKVGSLSEASLILRGLLD